MVLELLEGWHHRHNQLVAGIEAEAEAREEMSGGSKDGREEPNAGTVVVERQQMKPRLGLIASEIRESVNDHGAHGRADSVSIIVYGKRTLASYLYYSQRNLLDFS
jgi:hypothetical protein